MTKNPLAVAESGVLLLDSKSVPFSVVRSPKRKRTIAFKVDAKNGVIIQAPMRTSLSKLKKMALQHGAWILQKYDEKIAKQPKKLSAGEYLPYLGQNYLLQLATTLPANQTCCLINDQIHVRITADLPKDIRNLLIQRRLTNWYRQQAQQIVGQRLQIWIQSSALRPTSWRITSAFSRWGSCSEDNKLCFNWRLIFVPLALLDYVVVHELCHIVHKNHSKSFWNLVGKVLPDYRELRLALKEQEMHF